MHSGLDIGIVTRDIRPANIYVTKLVARTGFCLLHALASHLSACSWASQERGREGNDVRLAA
jgi:hypothetical protein